MKMLNQDSNIEWKKKRRRKTMENKREMLLTHIEHVCIRTNRLMRSKFDDKK